MKHLAFRAFLLIVLVELAMAAPKPGVELANTTPTKLDTKDLHPVNEQDTQIEKADSLPKEYPLGAMIVRKNAPPNKHLLVRPCFSATTCC